MFLLLKFRCSLWWFLTMFIWLLHMLLVILASSENIRNANTSSCIERERQALLSFKSGLIENTDLLSSWRSDNKDCCRWIGVYCSHKTGHITALDLSPKVMRQIDNKKFGFFLGGEIGPSLLNLTYLHYLDLSYNIFSRFPAFIGSLNGLRYLNLSHSFSVESVLTVPPQLGNLSKLEYLDFGCRYCAPDTLEWVSRLSSLRNLQMEGLNLSSIPNSFQTIMSLPSLVSLSFEDCTIFIPTFPSNSNSSTFLEVIHIIGVELNSPVALFKWLNVSHQLVDLTLSRLRSSIQNSFLDFVGPMTSLEHLDLSRNYLEGQIPTSWGNLCKLQTLDLSENSLNGTLNFIRNWTRCPHNCVLREFHAARNQLSGPLDFTNFTSLEVLDVSKNHFNGTLLENIWKLSNLIVLDVQSNFLEGVISDSDISNLHKLKSLDLSFNSFKLNLSSNWVPPFQLKRLYLGGCKLGPTFPNWIRTQENLVYLDISNLGISDVIPSWFWDMCNRLKHFNISYNNMWGKVLSFSSEKDYVDLSSNQFDEPLPWISSNVSILVLSKNKFSGNISFLCSQEFQGLTILDLSSNLLSGKVPDCWMNYPSLVMLDLSNNNFWGTIPGSIGTLPELFSLRLSNNNLSGKLPSSFLGQELACLGLGENQLSGNIPTWIGSLTVLVVLELQSNKFWGNIPKSLCQMENIQVLDLSLNNLSGTIPRCLNNLSALAQETNYSDYMVYIELLDFFNRPYPYSDFFSRTSLYSAWVTWKGIQVACQKAAIMQKLIDLSGNQLSGEIPGELVNLYYLISLNLSSNKLIGPIPGKIGQLRQLESLDLSNNQLSGRIPESINYIYRLSYLDLSNNNLSGRIPSSTQMLTFNATAFEGNPSLCGHQLATKCPGDGNLHSPPITNRGSVDDSSQEDEEWLKSPWFYGSVALGYAIGFWGVCGPLVLYASFRQAYFQFLNKVKDSLLLAIALKRAKLKRWLQY